MKPVIDLLRQRGFRLIMCLDDMLLMANSQDLVLFQAVSTLNLLESLGFVCFVVNYKISQLQPLQQLEFLGVLVDNLSLHLPHKSKERYGKIAEDF